MSKQLSDCISPNTKYQAPSIKWHTKKDRKLNKQLII